MAKQTINIGSTANDGTGSTLRVGGDIINDNFNEIYTAFGDGSTLTAPLTAAGTATLTNKTIDLVNYIKTGIPDSTVTIEDLKGDGDHYSATVISKSFKGKTKIEQHKRNHLPISLLPLPCHQ